MIAMSTHSVQVAGLTRELPLFEVAPGVTIAILNILGDVELVRACAKELASKLAVKEYDVLLTAEAKSIPLIHTLAEETNKPYVVLRKNYKSYMGDVISAETVSITTNSNQTLYLDAKDQPLVAGRRVVLLDDVVSTGSTQLGMRTVVEKAGGTVVAEAAIFTEGDRAKWAHVIALGHLPVFTS
ncbi:MAG: adenine phosphoribosyltransferase [Anaerolineales bacterium]|nr:MAG: adenine phosphoribosyltransferase [Anaerolineales bacterium]